MTTKTLHQQRQNTSVIKALASLNGLAMLMLLGSVVTVLYWPNEQYGLGLAKLALFTTYAALFVALVSIISKDASTSRDVMIRLTIIVSVVALFAVMPGFWQVITTLLPFAAATAIAVTLVWIASMIFVGQVNHANAAAPSKQMNSAAPYKQPSVKPFKRGGPKDPYRRPDGTWICNAMLRRPQMVHLPSDATVGLQNRYEDYDIPAVTWDNMIGNMELQVKVREALLAIQSPWFHRYPDDPLPTNAPNGILFLGDPGNGKTFIAEMIAGSKKLPLFTLTKDIVTSQWVGETNKAVRHAFETVKANAPCVMFIDEIDSFISARGRSASGNAGDAEVGNIVNTFQTQLVELRKYPVIVVGATNHFDKLDAAAVREGRFDFKITVDNPDEKARIGLLRQSLTKHVPQANFNWTQIDKCAIRFNGFNVKRMLAIGERMVEVLRKSGKNEVGHDEVMASLRIIQGTKGRIPENALKLNELVLPRKTRLHVDNLLRDLKNIAELEEYGGEIMRGVLFYGPAGTGKTSVAKTVAKESQWGFIAVTGPDLAADPELMQKTYDRAKSYRPCVIFIDEADAVLRDRTMSQYPEVTNKLLTIMQGAEDTVKDVVFIAATNHPDMIDPALLRTGRFTGKVEFENPGLAELDALSKIWLTKRSEKVTLAPDVHLSRIFAQSGLSQANMEGVLQEALNNAVRARNIENGKAVIRNVDIAHAMDFIKA